jgi:hypothetical protein
MDEVRLCSGGTRACRGIPAKFRLGRLSSQPRAINGLPQPWRKFPFLTGWR